MPIDTIGATTIPPTTAAINPKSASGTAVSNSRRYSSGCTALMPETTSMDAIAAATIHRMDQNACRKIDHATLRRAPCLLPSPSRAA
jgi:hypothetical protein